jgi:predicted DNA-binding ribbon-helix-helix protein
MKELAAPSLTVVTAPGRWDRLRRVGSSCSLPRRTSREAGGRTGWLHPDRPGSTPARRTRLSGLIKRSFSLAGHRTSVALEHEFWVALIHIAAERRQTLTALVAAVDAERDHGRPLASALRVLALREFFPAALTCN